jgi:ATP-dependent helicase/nuclease subunit A
MNDLAARERIRSDLETTLIVEAAAGTGKTTELVARIISLVRSGVGLDRILSVTFTDKAAGEMKLRLRSELEKARAGAAAVEHDRFTLALSRLEVAQIGTIHSLCADLLRERPVEARVDPLFEVAAGETADRLFDQAFDAWFQQAVADPPEGVRRLLRRKSRFRDAPGQREVLREAGRGLADHRDFAAPWRREPFDRAGAVAALVDRIGELAEISARAQRPQDWCAKSLAELARWHAELVRREALRGRDDDGVEAELSALCKHKLWAWKGNGKFFAPGLERASVVALRDAVKVELEQFTERAEADLAACLHDELRPLIDAYEALKTRAGCLDFLDLLLRARDLVRDDRQVREELQARFSRLLVDEFQDTDPLQAEILLLLAADDPAERDWTRAHPVPGKLFVVGDPKQSIYRFRRADIALYEDVKARLLSRGAQLLHLTVSFRSVPSIQAAVNAAFAPRMISAGDGAQASYVALDPARPEPAGRPTVVALPAPKIYGDRGVAKWIIEKSYPDAVGAFVDFLVRKSGWTVTERDKPDAPAPLEARHICLLFKRMQSFGDDLTRGYVRALEARRIAHVLVGGRSYHEREEILAVRNAATAIEWPGDELAVFATLRGPFFALGDDALLLFHERQGKLQPTRAFDPAALLPAELEVAAALAILRELHLRRNRRPIADTLSRLLDQTRAHAGIAIWPTGEQALANVLQVLELARRFEAAGASSFRGFVDRLAADAERGESGEAPVVEEGTEGVRIMSVHKAKGLEFPVVILCDPTAPLSFRNPSRHVDPARKLWAMPLAGCVPAELLEHREAVLQRDREEAVRVAYVAATRARDLLVVPQTGDGELEGWLDVLNPALLPRPLDRRSPREAPGCPPFGKETVLDRPEGVFAALSVAPGLHAPQAGAHEVVWWDPASLELNKEPAGGIRGEELLVEDDVSRPAANAASRGHDEWRARRAAALAQGLLPSLRIATPSQLDGAHPAPAAAGPLAAQPNAASGEAVAAPAAGAQRSSASSPDPRGGSAPGAAARAALPDAWALPAVDGVAVAWQRAGDRESGRPGGKRFGILVHATLAAIDLRADAAAVARAAAAEGRQMNASEAEVQAAARAVSVALRHPLLARAAKSADCRRETPLFQRAKDGTLIEGVVDLAFREHAAGAAPLWTVVDFKTDARAEDHPHYLTQLRLYCAAVTAATGEPAQGVILSV